jgi:hypothetical protein
MLMRQRCVTLRLALSAVGFLVCHLLVWRGLSIIFSV